jgi:shikimate dehydrogenase
MIRASSLAPPERGIWITQSIDLRSIAWNGVGMSILSGHARVAGIAGWPVTYSRSPRLHGFWLHRYRIDGAYIPLPIRPGNLPMAMRGLLASGFAGANVTIPHKLTALEICDTVDDTARRAGAVNTLTFQDGKIAGSNTDGYGFVANLRAHGVEPAAGPALLLGAGGSARAVAAALLEAGAAVTVANRTLARAEALARDLPGLRIVDWDARVGALSDHALVVNTTPLGMLGHGALDLDLSGASPTVVVADNVYVPLETPLLAAARGRGLRCVEGLGMLLHQAVPGFHTWFGVKPEVDAELRQFVASDLMSE